MSFLVFTHLKMPDVTFLRRGCMRFSTKIRLRMIWITFVHWKELCSRLLPSGLVHSMSLIFLFILMEGRPLGNSLFVFVTI